MKQKCSRVNRESTEIYLVVPSMSSTADLKKNMKFSLLSFYRFPIKKMNKMKKEANEEKISNEKKNCKKVTVAFFANSIEKQKTK